MTKKQLYEIPGTNDSSNSIENLIHKAYIQIGLNSDEANFLINFHKELEKIKIFGSLMFGD